MTIFPVLFLQFSSILVYYFVEYEYNDLKFGVATVYPGDLSMAASSVKNLLLESRRISRRVSLFPAQTRPKLRAIVRLFGELKFRRVR